MGITGLLGQLPCESVTGFRKLKLLANKKKKVDIDTGTMIYVCALIHKEAYNAQNYIPSVREFHGLLIILSRIHKWDFTCIFDGRPPLEKQHEHSRRQAKEDTIIITSDYIAMCVEVCKGYFIPYIVAPAEADMYSYCAICKAGCGLCYHRAGLCWMQHLHWGDGRPTPKPATAEFCSWVAGCRSARICSSLLPASEIHIERLPGSNEEAKAKFERGIKKNMHQGISARYDVFGGDERKRALLRDPRFCSAQRFEKLFNNLRKAQMNDDLVEDEDEV